MSGNERIKGVQVHRGIIYGSVARLLTPEERALAPPDHTHRWTIFVTSAAPKPGALAQASSTDPPPLDHIPGGGDDLSYLIKKVTFKLHETIPNPSRNIDKPPFQVTETGWGEFAVPIRIQFVPEAAEKAITVNHSIRLHHWGPPIETVAVPAPLPPAATAAPAASSSNEAGVAGATDGASAVADGGLSSGAIAGDGTAGMGSEGGGVKPDLTQDGSGAGVKESEKEDAPEKDKGKGGEETAGAKEAQEGEDVEMTDSSLQKDQKAAVGDGQAGTTQATAASESTTANTSGSAAAPAPSAAQTDAAAAELTPTSASTPNPTSVPTPAPPPSHTADSTSTPAPTSTPTPAAVPADAETPAPEPVPAPAPAPMVHVTPLSIATRYPVHAWQYDELVFNDPYSSFLAILNAHTPTSLPARIKRVRDQREDYEGDKRRKKGGAAATTGAGAGGGASRTRGGATATPATNTNTSTTAPDEPSSSGNGTGNNVHLTPASIIAITEKDRLGIPGEPGSADVPLEFTTEMEKAEWNRLNDARIKVIEEMDRWRERLIGREKEIEGLRKSVGR